jgi:hypothetical protein
MQTRCLAWEEVETQTILQRQSNKIPKQAPGERHPQAVKLRINSKFWVKGIRAGWRHEYRQASLHSKCIAQKMAKIRPLYSCTYVAARSELSQKVGVVAKVEKFRIIIVDHVSHTVEKPFRSVRFSCFCTVHNHLTYFCS